MSLLNEIAPYNPGEREFPVFDRQLIDYLPQVVREVEELKQIMSAEQPEVFELWESAQQVMNEQFIGTMSDYGARRWEAILRITPLPSDSLNDRKERILAMLRMRTPYTYRWLTGWLLGSLGEGNYEIDIDRYTIKLRLFRNRWPESHPVNTMFKSVLEFLMWIRPANMVLEVAHTYEFFQHLYACAGLSLYTLTAAGPKDIMSEYLNELNQYPMPEV